jgi:glycosyltransferase involved in cell wall biosynthesis
MESISRNKTMNILKVTMVGNSLNHQGGITTVQRLILQYQPSTLDVHQIATHERGTITHRIKMFGLGLVALIGHFLTQKVDLVHIHCADGGSVLRKAIVALIAMLFHHPVVMHVHADLDLTYKALPAIAQMSLKWVFQRCDRFILLSQSMQNFCIKRLNLDEKKMVILPNPIELPQTIPDRSSALDEKTHELVILFLGRISKLKGVFDLIQAFSRLSTGQRRSLKLLLAGDGDIEQAKLLVEQLQLADHVIFLGWIDANKRNALLSKADIFALPSHTEQLPMAILEAMAWGVPVITCPVGGIPDVVVSGKNGLLVPPGNVKQMADAMQSLVDDPSLRRSLGLEAQRRATEFDIRHYVMQLEKIYLDCIS